MKVSVASLGGAGEIGMNMYIYETDRYAVIVDCGVKFAKSEDPGIDLIIPDFSYIDEINHKNILLLITHAHEDHIGAVGFLLKKYPNILTASGRYTYDITIKRLKEYDIEPKKIYLDDFMPFEWGDFEIKPYPVSHSIHGTYAYRIKIHDEFTFFHISDYKIDTAPVTCAAFPVKEFVEAGKEGIDCLLADSTNIMKNGYTKGEHCILEGLEKVFENATGRIFFTTFASNTERLQSVFNYAEKYNRKIILEGSSLIKNIDTARKYGKLTFDDGIIVSRKQMEKMDENRLCFIATGSQGEYGSVITKISENDYSNIKIRKGDTFVFSSRIIPGNEHRIITVINNIYQYGGQVVTADDYSIHVSGHSSRDDGRLLINILKPKYIAPIHGEIQHLISHIRLAQETGIDEKNTLFFLAGKKLIFENKTLISQEDIKAGKMYVDINMGEILDTERLKNRKRLAINGVIVVVNTAGASNNIEEGHLIIKTAGFILEEEYISALKAILLEYNEIDKIQLQYESFTEYTEKMVKRFFKKRFNKKPVIEIINI